MNFSIAYQIFVKSLKFNGSHFNQDFIAPSDKSKFYSHSKNICSFQVLISQESLYKDLHIKLESTVVNNDHTVTNKVENNLPSIVIISVQSILEWMVHLKYHFQ